MTRYTCIPTRQIKPSRASEMIHRKLMSYSLVLQTCSKETENDGSSGKVSDLNTDGGRSQSWL
jgi:hypothetical protein